MTVAQFYIQAVLVGLWVGATLAEALTEEDA